MDAMAHNSKETDDDGDGMPGDWEAANGLNPSIDDSVADPDSDGLVFLTLFNLARWPA